MVSKGQYNASTQYSPLDIVSFRGGSYLAKQETLGHEPTLNQDSEYWQQLAAPGAEGQISILETKNEYQLSDNGQVVPAGTWSNGIPSLQAGKYLWTRTTIKLNIGDAITYAVAHQGLNGAGSVTTVNNIDPDSNGNISIQASDILTNDGIKVQDALANLGMQAEQTSNGMYIKFPSGIMICMIKLFGISLPVIKQSSGVNFSYFSDNNYPGFTELAKWPQEFVSQPYISITPNSTPWNIIGAVTYDEVGITQIVVGRPNNTTDSVTLNVSCIAYGRWK